MYLGNLDGLKGAKVMRLPSLVKEYDGDQSNEAPKEARGVQEVQEASKDAKKVQLMMQRAPWSNTQISKTF